MIPAFQCEIDNPASDVLKKHWPNVPNIGDVRNVRKENTGSIDLICGGFPCQDVSIAGKRAGLAGERSGLWFEFARVIDDIEPEWVVIENVPGLLSSNRGQDFAVILRWLVERGYGVSWRILDAQYFGVPQRRRRVFIVASFGSGRSAEVLFERESSPWDTPPSREAGQGIASTLRAGAGAPKHDSDFRGRLVADTFTIRSGKDGGGKGYLGAKDKAMTLGGQQQHAFIRQRSDEYKEGDIVSTISQRDYKSASDLIAFGIDSEQNVLKEKAGTLRAHRSGGNEQALYTPLVGVRRLTPTECERLQGFPDGWTDGQSDTQRYRQSGNAVAVPVAEWLGKQIAALADEA